MAGPSFLFDPQARLDFHIDWTAWLAGDVLTASTWDADPAGIVTIDATSFTATVATVWVLGVALTGFVALRNHITTQEGRQEDRTITLYLLQR